MSNINLTLDKTTYAKVQRVADKLNTTLNKVIRSSVMYADEKWLTEVTRSMNDIVKRGKKPKISVQK